MTNLKPLFFSFTIGFLIAVLEFPQSSDLVFPNIVFVSCGVLCESMKCTLSLLHTARLDTHDYLSLNHHCTLTLVLVQRGLYV